MAFRVAIGLALTVCSPAGASDAPWRTDFSSPRIDMLRRRASEDGSAVTKFWDELKTIGAPLVETLPDDADHLLVTFVYRGTPSTASVVLDCQLIEGRDPRVNRMTLLPASDVWYKTYWLRKDMRLSYGFVVDGGPLVADPFNPHTSPGAPNMAPSALELPAAPPQPWITPRGNPAGQLHSATIDSTVLHTPRQIWIYTPPGFDRARTTPYPLMICFDGLGFASADYVPAHTILDNLLAAGRIPAVVLVLIGQSAQPGRNLELSNDPRFVDYVASEVVPYIRREWDGTSDPARTIVCGSSAGGLASAYFAFRRPDVFGKVLSQSGAFWPGRERDNPEHEWLTHQFASSPRLPIQFVLQVGILERGPTPLNGPSILESNRRLRDVLLRKGYDLHYSEVAGGHDPLNWRGGIAEGVSQLLGGRGGPVAAVGGIVAAFENHPIVIIGEWRHDVRELGQFYVRLVRDPAFQSAVHDIVIEFASRSNQTLVDRYIAGDELPLAEVRRIWRDTTKVAAWESPMYAEWLAAIREVNRTLPEDRRFRVLAGDTPVDWSRIRTHKEWADLGDNNESFAAVIDDELARHRRALVVLGANHVGKLGARTGAPNTTTIVRRRHPGATYVVMHHYIPHDPAEALLRLPDPATPSLYDLAGTPLGETADANGVPPIRYTDAWLYVGPAGSLNESLPPPSSLDPAYMREVDRRSMIEWGELRARSVLGPAAAKH